MPLNHRLVSTRNQLEQMLQILEKISDDIGFQFGPDKRRILTTVRGRIQSRGYDLETAEILRECRRVSYLGIKQECRIVETKKFFTLFNLEPGTFQNSRIFGFQIHHYMADTFHSSRPIMPINKISPILNKKIPTYSLKIHPEMAIQDKVIRMKYNKSIILKLKTMDKCQKYNLPLNGRIGNGCSTYLKTFNSSNITRQKS